MVVEIARHRGAAHVTAAGRDERRVAALHADATSGRGRVVFTPR